MCILNSQSETLFSKASVDFLQLFSKVKAVIKKCLVTMSTDHAVSQLSFSTRAIHLLLCAGGIIVCYSTFSIYQEKITRKHYGHNKERFTYMQALVFVQCAVNVLVSFFARVSGNATDNVPRRLYTMCSISYSLAMLFSNLALEWINYPTQVLGKSCKPIPILLFGVIFAHKRHDWKKYVYVMMIVFGMAIFLLKEEHSSKLDFFEFGCGELLLLASLACDGVTGAVQDHTRSHYITEKWTMMFYMNLFATLFLAVTILISGELFKFVNFIGDYPFVLNDMFMFAISGAAGQCFIFKTVTDFGPLTCSIVTTVRKLASLVFSVMIFHHPFTRRHMLGTTIVFVALFLDALESRRRHKNSSKQYKPVSTDENSSKVS